MFNFRYTIAVIFCCFFVCVAIAGDPIKPIADPLIGTNPTKKDSLNRDIPKCPPPIEVQIIPKTSTAVLIIIQDVSALPNEIAYEIRYKRETGISSWKTEYLTNGNEYVIKGLNASESYIYQIRKLCLSVDGSTTNSDWITVNDNYRTPSGPQCDELGSTEIHLITDHIVSSSVPDDYFDTINDQGCRIVLKSNWRNPGGSNYNIYRIHDGSLSFDYEDDLIRLYPAADVPHNYLFQMVAFVACPSSPSILPLGEIYSQAEWNALHLTPSCADTIVYNAPVVNNLKCGDPFTIPTPNTDNLLSMSVGDTVRIGGYPMAVTTVTGGSGGTYSGTADILLPWQGQTYNVPFSSMPFDRRGNAKSGSITLESDPLFDPEEIEPFEIGGEICIEGTTPEYWDSIGNNSVTGLPQDPYGFGPDSTYTKDPPYPGYEDGDPFDENYDPNGFDANGINVLTGTIYNEFGCTRDGLDSLGQPCNPGGHGPYYWLNESSQGPETEEGIGFAHSIEDTLSILLTELLDSMEMKLSDSIELQGENCDVIRGDMDSLMVGLDYDPDYIYGPENEYFNEGMHENFISRPKPFQVTMDRDPNTIALENKHIDLYDCDKKLSVLSNLKGLIEDFQGTEGFDELKELILFKIRRFTSSQVSQYQDMNEFKEWLKNEIYSILNQKYEDTYGSIGLLDDKIKIPELDFSWPEPNLMNTSLVSLNEDFNKWTNFHPGDLEDNLTYSIISQFKNGKLWINGVHRAFYLEEIAKNAAITEALTGLTVMPIRISQEIGGMIYTILIDRITLTTSGADLDAYLIIEDPRSGQKMVFQGQNIGFGPNGTTTDSNLSLANDVSIRLNNASKLIIHGTGDTFVSWDCNGFAGMGIDASIEFCRNFLTPLDTVTLEPLPESDSTRVQAHFKTFIQSWGNFYAEISIDPFAVTNAEQIRWVVDSAAIDFSDIASPDITFPDYYTSPNVVDGQPTPAWKGFHISQLSATLTGKFANDGDKITIGAQDVIIDDRGFTGEVFVQSDIVSLENGSLGGWPFSIDSMRVLIIANHLMGGALSGYLNVPIFESTVDPDPDITEKDCFRYRAAIHSGGGFCFSISTENNHLKADLFKAGEVFLHPNSSINITVEDSNFIAKATLNGALKINAAISASFGFNLDSIAFSGVEISNVKPYFSPGLWSIPGGFGIHIGGFKASIRNIGLVKETDMDDDEVAVRFIGKLSLAEPESELDIWAEARTRIIGKLMEVNGRQKWVYDRIKIDDVLIDANIKGNRVSGGLVFYDEEAPYYHGFKGIVKFNIKSLKVDVWAVAQFGKHEDNFNYFLVDALVTFGNGVGAGTFKILGLGGGLYYHMERDTSAFDGIPVAVTGEPSLGDLGVGLSNIVYTPDEGIGIGFKATIVFCGINKKAFNGNASFQMVFNSEGGIHEIAIDGNARFMSDVEFSQAPTYVANATTPPFEQNEIPLSAFVNIRYDFANRILDGNLNVFLNTPTFSGIGPNGQMVWAKLYFSPTKWFINIGTPSHPCGVVFEIPGVGQIGEVTAYIDIGTNIENMPPLPSKVSSLTGTIRAHPMRGSGKGFAFGAALKLNTGEIKFLILRATLDAAAGFDVLIQDYGEATCFNTGNKPGINGWYASGQAYAFVEGKVGVKVGGRIIPVIQLAIAAALQARLPNPTWMQGGFGVRYRLLGGLIKGNVKFRFKLGQQCELIQPGGDSSVLDLKIIQDISPSQASYEVIPDQEVVVSFNYDITKKVEDETDENNSYKIKVEQVTLTSHGFALPFSSQILEDGYSLVCKPVIYLPENDTINFSISLGIYQNNELIDTESDTVWFITSSRTPVIPDNNILASYPIRGQYNYYKKEYKEEMGYVMLDIGQPYLFTSNEKPYLLLIQSSGETYELHYTYDFLGKRIDFELPASILSNGELYKLALIKDSLNSRSDQESAINLPGLKPEPPPTAFTSVSPTTDLTLSDKQVLTQWVFRVSEYNTFKAKIDYLFSDYSAEASYNIGQSIITPSVQEIFDELEYNLDGVEPLISIKSNMDLYAWYNNEMYKKMYQYWPDGLYSYQASSLNRNTEGLGIPPVEAVTIKPTKNCESKVTEDHFLTGTISTGPMNVIVDKFIGYLRDDWNDLRKQLKEWFLEEFSDSNEPLHDPRTVAAQYLVDHDFPMYTGTSHTLLWEYILPGTGQITSSFQKTYTVTNHN